MTPQRARDVERICQAALEQEPSARSAFLVEACAGDGDLRREVESLLAHESGAASFLSTPAVAVADRLSRSSTSLIGRRVGSYQVLALIDAGGMGEVYRARDTRLGRDVALKILPPAVMGDADRLARFEREARVLASLDHPNIGTIHGVEDSDGVRALVLALVEGETLAERLAHGPLALAEVIANARQIADALQAAHEAGIVHRDLKPGNIMIAPSGLLKVLDFGLAKPVAAAAAASQSPTLTIGGTREGAILGTAAYMSPEQARGQAVDTRTDIWAFGCVLFEMLSGRAAFARDTVTDTLVAVVEQPPDWATLPASTPPPLVRLLRRCLEKDARRRLRDIGDAAVDMDEGLSFTDTSPVSSDAQLMAGLIRHRGAAAAAVTALLVAVAGVAYFLKSGTPAPSTADASSPSIASLQVDRLTTSGTADTPAISPDGNYVVYVERGSGGDSLRVRQVATGSNVEIVPLEPGTVLLGATVTPDGAFVNYVKQAAGQALELWQTTLLPGAAPRRLLQGGSVSFSPGGDQMAFVRANTTGRTELVVAASDGSGEHVVSSRQLPKGFWAAASSAIPPAWSPNGATIAVVGFGGALASDGQIVLVDVKSGSERVVDAGLISGTTGVAWLTDDTLLVSRGDKASTPLQLWIVSSADGAFRRLTNDTNQYVGVSLTADRNSLVAARSESSFNILISDATATEWSQPMPTKSTKGPGLAGVRWIGADLVFTSIASQGMALSRWRASIQKEEVLAQGGGRPSVTRDGSTIVFFDYDSAELLNMEAPGQKRVPIPGAGLATLAQVTPDGRHYVTIGLVAGAPAVVLASLDGVTSRVITPDRVRAGTSLLDRRRAEVSPDGKWIAYSSFDEGGQPVIAVCDLASCSSRRTLSAPAAQWWRWTPDSKALAYVDRKTQSDLWAQPLDGGAPHQLTHFAPDGRQIWDFDWSADGRLAVARGLASSDIVLFRGLQARR